MDIKRYNQYLREYLAQALKGSDMTNRGIAERLGEIQVGRWFVSHKVEKQRALYDLRVAFEEHRHWPLDIVLSHLGFKKEDLL